MLSNPYFRVMDKFKSVLRYLISITAIFAFNFGLVEQVYLHLNNVIPSIHNNWIFNTFYAYTGCMEISPSYINILLTLSIGIFLGRYLRKVKFSNSLILLCFLIVFSSLPSLIYEQLSNAESTAIQDFTPNDTKITKANIINSAFQHYSPIDNPTYFSIDTVIQLQLNKDEHLDYYIVTKEGETPLYKSHFYDGKTGKEYNVDLNLENGPLSEYNMTSKKVKASWGNNLDAIITSRTISCLIGEQVDVWRYNLYTQQIESELTFNTTNGNCAVLSDSLFYSNLYNYSESGIDTVFIYPGKTIEKENRISIDNIQPISSSPLFFYVFNTEIGEWVKNK